jgi:hypothetical protein
MADSLHQMTAEYVPAQDRILFRVNTQEKLEYRVWLTRRLVRNLWGVAVKSFAAKPEVSEQPRPQVKQAMMSMQHQQAVQSSNFKQKHATDTKPAPDAETPLLAIATQITQINKTTIRLTFVTAERKAVNLHLTEDMLHAVCYIMQTAADRAGWDLKLSVGDAAAVPQIEAGQVH